MRILMISQWFQPEPLFKGLPFARELATLGHEVQVLTGFPNYPEGKVYEGYRIRPLQREIMDGIEVLRVPLYPDHSGSGLKRMINYGTFALSAAALGPWLVRKADVAYVYHSPATIALPAMLLKALRGIPFVYDVNDLWPDTLTATGMFNSSLGMRMMHRWCNLTYRKAARVTVVSPGFQKILISRGVPEDKIDMIYNWCEGTIAPAQRDEGLADRLGMSGRFNVVFAGTMGKAQALDAVMEAARLVAEKLPDVQFMFVGGGIDVDRLKALAAASNLGNVTFLPRMETSEIGAVLALADALLVHLRDDPLFRITIPSKTQAYLAAGRPVLNAVAGDSADLVEQAQAGLICEPENPESIAAGVEKLFAMPREERERMGRRGHEFYQRELALSIAARRYEAIFRSVVEERR